MNPRSITTGESARTRVRTDARGEFAIEVMHKLARTRARNERPGGWRGLEPSGVLKNQLKASKAGKGQESINFRRGVKQKKT